MTTKSLRDILRKAAEPDFSCINMRIASEIHRPGGGVFIAARKTAASERQTESNIALRGLTLILFDDSPHDFLPLIRKIG